MKKFGALRIKRGFLKNVLTLMSGSVIAQIVFFIAAPILTRLYTANQFGIYGVFFSTVSILSIGIGLSYELSVLLPPADEDAKRLFLGTIAVCGVNCLAISMFVIVGITTFPKALGDSKMADYLWLVPISVFLAGAYRSMNYYMTRFKKYEIISKARIIRNSGIVGSQICFGVVFPTHFGGLIVGFIVGQIANFVYLVKSVVFDSSCKIFSGIGFNKTIKLFYRYRKFPLISSWTSLLETLSMYMPVYCLAYFFDTPTAGFFELSNRVVTLPAMLIGAAVSQVYFQEGLVQLKNQGSLSPMIEALTARLIQIIVIPVFCLCLFGPELFRFVFGEQWLVSGTFARILAPAMGMQFIAATLSITFIILERQDVLAYWKLTYLVSQSAIMFLSGTYLDQYGFVIFMSFGNLVLYALYLFLIFNYTDSRILSSLGKVMRLRPIPRDAT